MGRRSPRLLLVVLALVMAACSPAATTSTSASTSSTPSTSTTLAGLSGETSAEIRRLVAVTEEIRGLSFEEDPVVTVVSEAELEERVRTMIDEDLGDIEADAALYRLLGLVPADVDLPAVYRELYGEQVAGFYDGETAELVVPARSADFTPLEEATLVHELTHALVDSRLGMWDAYDRLVEAERFDEAAAFLALVEGDATLTQLLYIATLSPGDQQAALTESFAADTTALAAAPPFLQGSLLFPYQAGAVFVEGLHSGGGFPAVDAAYADPPVSTEQILTPGDYPGDVPVAVPLPEATLDGYEKMYESVWGELGFQLMFDQVLGGRPDAVSGWGGDSYAVWWNGTDVALGLVFVGDTPDDAAELAAALGEYVATAMAAGSGEAGGGGTVYSGDDHAFVAVSGPEVVFVAASDPAAGVSLQAALSAG